MRNLTLILFTLLSISLFAQRQKITEKYNVPSTTAPLWGNKTFYYITGEDGKNIKDGPFNVTANDNSSYYVNYENVKINANYSFKANYAKGRINGLMTCSYREHISSLSNSDTETTNVNGSFSRGIPNGNFSITHNGKTVLKATYKNGNLVGYFKINSLYNREFANISGTLTSDGKLNGKWVDDGGYTHNYLFQNGVLIKKSDKESSTKPMTSELSRKYASGTITEEELFKKNYIVKTDSFKLGDYAADVIISFKQYDLSDFGGYDLTKNNNPKYKYLQEIARLTEKGFNQVLSEINNYAKNRHLSWFNTISPDNQGEIFIQENGHHYLLFGESRNKELYTYIPSQYYYEKILISNEEYTKLNETMSKALKNNALNIYQYALGDVLNDYNDLMADKELPSEKINEIYNKLKELDLNKLEKTDDKNFLKFKNNNNATVYVNISEFDYLPDILQKISAKRLEALKKERLPILNLMLNKKGSNISYDSDLNIYFDNKDLDPDFWRLELGEKLKPFCRMIKIEIIDGDMEQMTVNITKRVSKKKGNKTYQIVLRYKGYNKSQYSYGSGKEQIEYKIDPLSFDIEKAKEITNNEQQN